MVGMEFLRRQETPDNAPRSSGAKRGFPFIPSVAEQGFLFVPSVAERRFPFILSVAKRSRRTRSFLNGSRP